MPGVLIKGVFEKKYQNLISGYQSIRTLEKGEIDSMNIILRGASLRFYLTRKIDNFKKKSHCYKKRSK